MSCIRQMFRIAILLVVTNLFATAQAVAGRCGQDSTSDWTRVREVRGGTVTVTRQSAPPIAGVVAVVDQSRLVLATPADALSSSEWRDVLNKAGSRWDAVAAGTERVMGRGHREVSREGLFQNGRKVASWTSIAREDIVAITGTVRKRGSLRGLIIGAAAGAGVGLTLYYTGVYLNNETGGGDVAIAGAIVVPIVAPLAGYFGFSHEERFLYRAATPLSLALDDAMWHRLCAALAPSFRGDAAK